jgi:lysophospholipase L1-like esterase
MIYRYFIFILSGLIIFSCTSTADKQFSSEIEVVTKGRYISASNKNIRFSGRIDFSQPGKALFSLPGVNIRFRFRGTKVSIHMKDLTTGDIQADGQPAGNFINVYIDRKDPIILELHPADTIYTLASGLRRKKHMVTLIKRTEALAGKIEFCGIWLEQDNELLPLSEDGSRKIEFIGNSITCGYGVEAQSEMEPFSCSTENVTLSYAYLTASALHADYNIVAYSGRGVAQNYDRSVINTMPEIWNQVFPDETEPVWDHKKFIPDITVINLGTNDFSFDDVDTLLFRTAYMDFLKKIRRTYPESLIVCVLGPMMNNTYPVNALNQARHIIQSVRQQLIHSGDEKIYYLELSPQNGNLGYGADWHPSAAQQRKNAKELTGYISEITGWKL